MKPGDLVDVGFLAVVSRIVAFRDGRICVHLTKRLATAACNSFRASTLRGPQAVRRRGRTSRPHRNQATSSAASGRRFRPLAAVPCRQPGAARRACAPAPQAPTPHRWARPNPYVACRRVILPAVPQGRRAASRIPTSTVAGRPTLACVTPFSLAIAIVATCPCRLARVRGGAQASSAATAQAVVYEGYGFDTCKAPSTAALGSMACLAVSGAGHLRRGRQPRLRGWEPVGPVGRERRRRRLEPAAALCRPAGTVRRPERAPEDRPCPGARPGSCCS